MSQRRTWKDETGELEKIAKEMIPYEFPLVDEVDTRILYAWVDPPEEDVPNDRIIAGKTHRLGARDRDLYGYDIAIVIAHSLWQDKDANAKRKLMWHELNHIAVVEDPKKGGFKVDPQGRIMYKLREHDLNLERFAGEIIKFGADDGERAYIDTLVEIANAKRPGVRCACAHPDATECAKAGKHLGAGVRESAKASPGAGSTIPDTATAPDADNTTKMAAAGSGDA